MMMVMKVKTTANIRNGRLRPKHIPRHMNRNPVRNFFLDTLHSDYDYEDEDNSNDKNTQWAAGWWEEREEVLIMGTSDPVCAP